MDKRYTALREVKKLNSCFICLLRVQARKALAEKQKDLEVKTQQLEIKLSSKIEEDIKKARRKSTQAGQFR